jgi:hypothetical protein
MTDEYDEGLLKFQSTLPAPDLLIKGIYEFNSGAYFEQHETLETAWRKERGPIRLLYQGILQVGVAYLHIQNQNYAGALKVLGRAIQHLSRLPSSCQTVDVEQLRSDAATVMTELKRLGPDRIGLFNPVLLRPVQFVDLKK